MPFEHAHVLNAKFWCENTEKHTHASMARKISCKDNAISCTVAKTVQFPVQEIKLHCLCN